MCACALCGGEVAGGRSAVRGRDKARLRHYLGRGEEEWRATGRAIREYAAVMLFFVELEKEIASQLRRLQRRVCSKTLLLNIVERLERVWGEPFTGVKLAHFR